MSRSFELFGFRVDLGPHRFFSSDHRVNSLWLEIVGKNYKIIQRQTRILYEKNFYSYPLNAFDAISKLGIIRVIKCISSYAFALIFPRKDTHKFEGWMINKFGKELYSIFFKSYTEKLWGVSCNELDSTFAKQRIKKFSLYEAIKSALTSYKNVHKTLVDEFAYPIMGTGSVYNEMVRLGVQNGGNFSKDTFLTEIYQEDNQVHTVNNKGEHHVYDHVISSMPITDFLILNRDTPKNILTFSKGLKFRNTVLGYVKIKKKNLFSDQWIYIQENDITTGRITNFNNWIPELNPNNLEYTMLAMEYWCFESDEIWTMESAPFFKILSNDLKNCGFIESEKEISEFKKINIPKCYPMYDNNYESNLNPIIDYLKKIPQFQFVGRYGSFKYNNQDHSILMGWMASMNIIIGKKEYDLWEVNSDYEYQESSLITATGLVKI